MGEDAVINDVAYPEVEAAWCAVRPPPISQ